MTGTVQAATDPLQSNINEKLKAQKDAQATQENVDALAMEARDLLYEYKTALSRTESLKIYNDQLEKHVSKQKKSLASLQKQLENLEITQRDFVPFMLRMVDTLEKFVALDLPFLTNDRNARVNLIKEMMDRPDITLPDKYRRIMEAYQIEMEYGRTIEAYNDMVSINDQTQTVDILRVGRLVLVYLTLDGKTSGIWDKEKKTWQPLSAEYNRSIAQGLKIAQRQSPPELFKLPIPAPENMK
jgi:chromosome segregation ATPase